jgi:hypothetical protein
MRSAAEPGARIPYTSCSSAISLSSIPTSTSVSVTISTGMAGSTGSTMEAPTAAPTPAAARDEPRIRASASSSGEQSGNWRRSVAWSRTGSRGASAITWSASQRPAECAPRQVTWPPRPTARAVAAVSRLVRAGDPALLRSSTSPATCPGSSRPATLAISAISAGSSAPLPVFVKEYAYRPARPLLASSAHVAGRCRDVSCWGLCPWTIS